MKRLYRYYKQNWKTGWETSFEINVFNDRFSLLFDFYFSYNFVRIGFLCFNCIWYKRLMPDCGYEEPNMMKTMN